MKPNLEFDWNGEQVRVFLKRPTNRDRMLRELMMRHLAWEEVEKENDILHKMLTEFISLTLYTGQIEGGKLPFDLPTVSSSAEMMRESFMQYLDFDEGISERWVIAIGEFIAPVVPREQQPTPLDEKELVADPN